MYKHECCWWQCILPRPLAAGLEQTQHLSTMEGIQRSILVISLDKNFYKHQIKKTAYLYADIFWKEFSYELQVIQTIHSKDLKEMALNFTGFYLCKKINNESQVYTYSDSSLNWKFFEKITKLKSKVPSSKFFFRWSIFVLLRNSFFASVVAMIFIHSLPLYLNHNLLPILCFYKRMQAINSYLWYYLKKQYST